ncbi:DUF362 domain-containing protein [Sporomusa aerivorans]|uniref:DUF362 domain-containing protein n=1 Tax=Sporomusa aerivorans TaxID=204936 RepID=UPI00352AE931
MTKVAVVKTDSYDTHIVEQAMTELLDELGGISRFIQPGDRVLLKPNMLEGVDKDKAVTTHPEVLRAVIRQVKAAGGAAFVGDSPALGNIRKVAEITGIAEVCLQEKAELLAFEKSAVTYHSDGLFIKKFELAQELQQVDKVISLAKMKTHSLMGITGGVKNLFGFIVGPYKAQFHLRMQKQRDFAAMLADLNEAVKPVLHIIDGIVGMEGNGPRNGTPIKTGVLLAGTNGFAVDMVMANIMGFNAEKLPVSAWALSQKLAPKLTAIDIAGSAQATVVPYAPAKNLVALRAAIPYWLADLGQNQLTAKPVINDKCVGCGRCAAHCPPKTIVIAKGRAQLDLKNCIRCYCCQELCPHDAVDLKEGIWLKFVQRLTK